MLLEPNQIVAHQVQNRVEMLVTKEGLDAQSGREDILH